jgi:G3E family GTPase
MKNAVLTWQVEFADVILLNKCDTLPGGVGGAEAARLASLITTLNPGARVIPCVNSEVDLMEVINTGE